MRITAVTCVKNEGPFLLEWIAFNRVIGVTDHLFYSNDCDDGTDTLLDALAALGLCTHLPNPAKGRSYQMEALKDAARRPEVRDADWLWIADVDEFLNIHVGDGTIPELIAACDTPQALSVHFQYFANAGVMEFKDRPVVSQFTRTHSPNLWCDTGEIEVKTLIRRDFPLHYYGAHRPFAKRRAAREIDWRDGSGRPVPSAFLRGEEKTHLRRFPAKDARKLATLNHYALRSLESYLVKNDRGDVNRENRAFDLAYWRERNDQSWEECTILRLLPRLETELARLKSLPNIRARHDACVAAHRAKIAALRAAPGSQNTIAALQNAPTICAAEEAFLASLPPPVLALP